MVTLDELAWAAAADPDAEVVASNQRRAEQERVLASDGQYYQIAKLSAHLEPFDGDFQ